MPEPISTSLACGFAFKMGSKAADKYGDSILKSAEDAGKKAVKAVDEGLKRDYDAGGITAQLNNNSTQTA